MLKLISINIETNKHYGRILPFFQNENPDVICLQEAPETFAVELQKLGFETFFTPMCLAKDSTSDGLITMGLMFASKHPFESKAIYYHKPTDEIVLFDRSDFHNTVSAAYIFSSFNTPEGIYNIVTTHPLKTKDGTEDEFQTGIIKVLLEKLADEESHIICGDFNIPRGYNSNYNLITDNYRDCIPDTYKSSLDKELHVKGHTEPNGPITEVYMVDYVFTQPPYQVENVRLEFGLSDHAGIVAEINKTN